MLVLTGYNAALCTCALTVIQHSGQGIVDHGLVSLQE